MTRSLWKGDVTIEVSKQLSVYRVRSARYVIDTFLVAKRRVFVYTGRKFIWLKILSAMRGYKIGCFLFTRQACNWKKKQKKGLKKKK